MTPNEVKNTQSHITKKDVEFLAVFLEAWLQHTKQPSKNLNKAVKSMNQNGIKPIVQIKSILGSVYSWFRYGY